MIKAQRATKRKTRYIGEVSTAFMKTVIQSIGFTGVVESVAKKRKVKATIPIFEWKKSGTEAQHTANACQHIRQVFKSMDFDLEDHGFKLLDVHTRADILDTEFTEALMRGGTDAIIVPVETADEYPQLQIRVVVDLKYPDKKFRKVCMTLLILADIDF